MTIKQRNKRLEAEYRTLRRTYRDYDLNYQEFVRDTPLDDFIAEMEHYLAASDYPTRSDMSAWGSWDVYVAAKVFVIARDEGLRAARLFKLQNGGAA